MIADVDFSDALSCVSLTWHDELRFARSWADSVAVEWDDREEPTGCIVFTKGGAEYAFLIGDDCWDADDPRSEMIVSLLAERNDARMALDDATGPHCSSCGNAIDPECCWCGAGPDAHRNEEHGFIPMGCDCCRATEDRDWMRCASELRSRLWRTQRALRALAACVYFDGQQWQFKQDSTDEELRAAIGVVP